MRTKNAMQLKALIKNKATELNVPPQIMLQNYYMECFMDRLSKSEYSDNFIIKGGFLISSIIGLENRSTMDIDATIRNLNVTEEDITKIIMDICSVQSDDDFTFSFDRLEPIRDDDEYQGLRVFLCADYEMMKGTLTIDITTGDSIYPSDCEAKIKRSFEADYISIRSYPVETILAEKLETIITRGVMNTRPRDFYDVYILFKTVQFDLTVLHKALLATSKHRGTKSVIENESENQIKLIESSSELKKLWQKYQKKFPYATDILFEKTVDAVRELLKDWW